MVQWSELHASTARARVQSLAGGLRSHILHSQRNPRNNDNNKNHTWTHSQERQTILGILGQETAWYGRIVSVCLRLTLKLVAESLLIRLRHAIFEKEQTYSRYNSYSKELGMDTRKRVRASVQFSSVSHSVVSNSLWPHESQHPRPPCPSPTPGIHSDSRP